MPYLVDYFKSTPLTYAISRNSSQCVGILLEYAIQSEDFYKMLNSKELTDLIDFGPAKLPDFFQAAVIELEGYSIPTFGKLKKDVVYGFNENPNLEKTQISEMVDQTSDNSKLSPIQLKRLKFKYCY